MPNVFSRSWEICKLSFGVVKQDREMLLYPVFSAICSVAFLIAMLFPTIIVDYMGSAAPGHEWQVIDYILIFLVYYGLAFIATFFNVCVVYTAKTRFEGGNATLGSSFRFALSKIGQIAAWAFISAVVGVILAAIENAGKKGGTGAKIVATLTAKIGQAAWSIMTLFVIPVMVYTNAGPGEAMKGSWQTLKKTWGESIVKYFGMGLIEFLFILLDIVASIVLGYLLAMFIGGWGILYAVIVFIVVLILIVLVFSVGSEVYNTALYAYAETGNIPLGFNKQIMDGAFH